MLILRFSLSTDTDFSAVVSNTLDPLKKSEKNHLCNRIPVKFQNVC